ncbi:hypothetical protein VNO78_35287 [Psophocarpus tetragonolobus]|uniref:Uncharacterized protein n=1 Tax=Psophocarpus tetragonolobus TaxID=3891 RepID=A0AAN9NP21_PSOTE
MLEGLLVGIAPTKKKQKRELYRRLSLLPEIGQNKENFLFNMDTVFFLVIHALRGTHPSTPKALLAFEQFPQGIDGKICPFLFHILRSQAPETSPSPKGDVDG